MTTKKFRGVNGQIVAAALHESAQPLAGEDATPSGTPQQTHAETLERVARVLEELATETSYTHRAMHWRVKLQAERVAVVAAALRAPVGTCETCQHAITNAQGQSCGNRNSPLYHMGNIGTLNARHVSCTFHTPRPETPQEEK